MIQIIEKHKASFLISPPRNKTLHNTVRVSHPKTKNRMLKCDCYPHPAFPGDPDFSVTQRSGALFLKCNICGKVAKNAISHKYAEKRQFPIAPEGWDRGVHPDLKERFEAWEYVANQKLIAACDGVLEGLYDELELLGGSRPSERPKRRKGWKQLPSGLIVPN